MADGKYDNAEATRAMRNAWSSINYTLTSQRIHSDDVDLLTSIAMGLCADRLIRALDGMGMVDREDVAVVLANRSVVKGALSVRTWAHWKHQNPDLRPEERAKVEAIDKYMLMADKALADSRMAQTRVLASKEASSELLWTAMSGRAYSYAYTLKVLSMFTQLCLGVTVKVQHGK
jgi:hypothetical protein